MASAKVDEFQIPMVREMSHQEYREQRGACLRRCPSKARERARA